jgi:hypothetical protein
MLLAWPGTGLGETATVALPDQLLYSSPDFASPQVGRVPQAAEVNIRQRRGDWCQVEYQGQMGWIHRAVLRQAGATPPGPPQRMGVGTPVRETRSDEVALAGKGFTPEVESGYRQRHPELSYALVDQVEALYVDEAALRTFVQEGGLKP